MVSDTHTVTPRRARSNPARAVISDVWPDGTSYPVATGRLRSSYPNVIASRSLKDGSGQIVEPYGDYSSKTSTAPSEASGAARASSPATRTSP